MGTDAPTEPQGDIAATGKSFGRLLREEREARGLTLDELAERTRVRRHHLEALERDDFAALPGDVFVKGYLRTCATALGVEADLMIADYTRQKAISGDDSDVVSEMSRVLHVDEATRRRRRVGWTVAAVVATASVLVGWWAWPGRDRIPIEPERPQVRTEPSPPSPQVKTEPEPPSPQVRTEPSPPSPQVKTEPEPPSPQVRTEPSALTVPDHGVGTAVVDRVLVGRAERFPAGSRVVFWTRVVGGAPGDAIEHVWIRNGVEQDRIRLRVGSTHWRTHSKKTLFGRPGDRWAVEARDAGGALLTRQEFATDD